MSLIIQHTEAEGTLLLGTARGDGSAEVVKPLGWRWGRRIGLWFVPRSRDAVPKRGLIDRTAEALRTAGFEVSVEIDATVGDRDAAEQRLVDRSQARVERLTTRAEKEQAKADSRYAAARAIADHIPLGQPILLGHHSQRRAERDAERIRGHFDASIEHPGRAEAAASAAGTAAASAGARHNPVTVANRIARLEAQIRRDEREMRRFDAGGGDQGSNYRVSLLDRLDAARADVAHWRAVRDQQIIDGVATNYSRQTVQPGDLVKISGHWRTVRRSNAKTVSVNTGYSWTDTAPWASVQDHRTAGSEQ